VSKNNEKKNRMLSHEYAIFHLETDYLNSSFSKNVGLALMLGDCGSINMKRLTGFDNVLIGCMSMEYVLMNQIFAVSTKLRNYLVTHHFVFWLSARLTWGGMSGSSSFVQHSNYAQRRGIGRQNLLSFFALAFLLRFVIFVMS
jgi:hypothetical protein